MPSMKRLFVVSVVLLTLFPRAPVIAVGSHDHKPTGKGNEPSSPTVGEPIYNRMPDPGKRVMIGNDFYFIYGFDKKPKMGTVIVRVELFTRDGKRDTSFEIKGDAGMPSMKGAHDTGDRPFRLSSKGVYLLPVDIVMPGNWEIRLTFLKDGKVMFRRSHTFDV